MLRYFFPLQRNDAMPLEAFLPLPWSFVLFVVFVAYLVPLCTLFAHELGHYMAARALGIVPSRFTVGAGPVLMYWRGPGRTLWVWRVWPTSGSVMVVKLALQRCGHLRTALLSVAGPLAEMVATAVLGTLTWVMQGPFFCWCWVAIAVCFCLQSFAPWTPDMRHARLHLRLALLTRRRRDALRPQPLVLRRDP